MGKVLFAALIGVLVWVFFFLKPRALGRKSEPPPRPSDEPKGLTESMVQCARCGVYIPASESVSVDGKLTCTNLGTCQHARR